MAADFDVVATDRSAYRRIAWCETHAEVVTAYPDGSFSCPYDLIVEGRNDHTLTPAPDCRPTEAELRAWLKSTRRTVALCLECGGEGVVDGLVIGSTVCAERCHACKGTGLA